MKTETLVRTVVLVFALLNQGLTLAGMNPLPFESEQVENFTASIFTVGASMWAWWKNNSFTKEAIEADKYKKGLKGA